MPNKNSNATSPSQKKSPLPRLPPERVVAFAAQLFQEDLHAKRVLSLGNGVIGVLHAAVAGVHAIGQGLATARGLAPKHAIKQIDRLLSNPGVLPFTLVGAWVIFVLGARKEAVVAMDWTDFDDDDQTTCALHLVTTHGRATPLIWKTINKSDLKGHQHQVEDEVLERFQQIVPKAVHLTLLADRGFGDQMRYDHLESMG
jgi:hypothetical protein